MVGAARHVTPAGKSDEYVTPSPPVTTALVPLASLRRLAGLVAGRKTKVPGMAVSEELGGVKADLRGDEKMPVAHRTLAPFHSRVQGSAIHDAEVGDEALPCSVTRS